MAFKYHLKKTLPVNILPIFKLYIDSNDRSKKEYARLTAALAYIQNLRSQLNINDIEFQMTKKLQDALQDAEKLLLYYRYLKILEKHFRLESVTPYGAVEIPFSWSNSFVANQPEDEYTTSKSITFEICSILYNYTVVCFNIGQKRIEESNIEERMTAIKLLRQVMWGIQELKVAIQNIASDVLVQQPDLTLQNLTLFSFLTCALIQRAAYRDKIEKNSEDLTLIAGFSRQASREYESSIQCIEDIQKMLGNHIPQDWLSITKVQADFAWAKSKYEAAFKMHENYLKMHKNQTSSAIFACFSSKSNNRNKSIAIGFLKEGQRILKECQQNNQPNSQLNNDQLQELKDSIMHVDKTLTELEKQNNSCVGKDKLPPIPGAFQLPDVKIEDRDNLAKALQPEQMGQELLQHQASFTDFLSEQKIQIAENAKNEADKLISTLDENFIALKTNKQKKYEKSKVNTTLDLAIPGQPNIPPSIKERLEKLKTRQEYKSLKKDVETLQLIAETQQNKLVSIQYQLEYEQDQDDQLRAKYQDKKWTCVESKQLTQQKHKQLKDYQNVLTSVLQDNKQLYEICEKQMKYTELIDLSDQELYKKIPINNRQQFLINNEDRLQEVKKLDLTINEFIQKIDDTIRAQKQWIQQTNFVEETVFLLKQEVLEEQQVLDRLLANLLQDKSSIRAWVEECTKKIDEISQLAPSLQVEQSQQDEIQGLQKETQEQISYGLDQLLLALDSVINLQGLFPILHGKIQILELKTREFLEARQKERNELLEKIECSSRDTQVRASFGDRIERTRISVNYLYPTDNAQVSDQQIQRVSLTPGVQKPPLIQNRKLILRPTQSQSPNGAQTNLQLLLNNNKDQYLNTEKQQQHKQLQLLE